MKGSNLFMLAALAGTSVAMAAPRESFPLGAMTSDHAAGTAGNTIVNVTATGADGGGSYTGQSFRLTGTVGTWLAATYTSEARFKVTPPNGTAILVNTFGSTSTGHALGNVNYDISVPFTGPTAGTWTVESYESFDDTGVDCVHSAVQLTIDDAPASVTPPSPVTALGDLSSGATLDPVITLTSPGEVRWFSCTLPAVSSAGGYVDIWETQVNPLAAAAATDMVTADIAVYNGATGALKTYDTTDGPGSFGQVSYGSTTSRGATTATGQANGAALAGADGALTAGVYYIAVGAGVMSNNTTGYSLYSNYAGTQTDVGLHIRVQPNLVSTPPIVSGGTCAPALALSGTNRLLTVTVAPALNPSSPTASVVADLTTIGGPNNAAFHNDGLNGDVSAADNIWSYQQVATADVGTYTITATASDSLGVPRTGTGTISVGVFAPPTTFTDVGDFSSGSHDYSVTTAEAATPTWFKVVLPAMPAAGLAYADFYCTTTDTSLTTVPAGDSVDPDLALYDNGGNKLVSDDLDGPGFWAQISCGSTVVNRGVTPTFGGQAAGIAKNGYDGPLAGGTYWLAQGHYSMAASAAGFGAVCGAAGGNTVVHIVTSDGLSPSNPILSAASATPASGVSGTPVTINVTVTRGANPTSANMTVTANLTALGGGSSVAMTDPDSDGIYSVATTIPAGATDFSSYSVQIDAVDDYTTPRHAAPVTVTIGGQATPWDETVNGLGDAGQTLATALVPAGTGTLGAITGDYLANDVDMYLIRVCDAANFAATTQFSPVATDSQLFMFSSDGHGVSFNDDSAGGSYSTLDNTGVVDSTNYYIAVTKYNVDPQDSALALLWNNSPFTGVRAPDGPGAANVFDSWTGTTTAGNAYRISLRGACYAPPAQCSPADVGVQGGGPGQDRLLNNNDFIAFIDLFFAQSPAADLGSQGGEQGSDNLWDNNDFIVFIDYFFNDTPNCQG